MTEIRGNKTMATRIMPTCCAAAEKTYVKRVEFVSYLRERVCVRVCERKSGPARVVIIVSFSYIVINISRPPPLLLL